MQALNGLFPFDRRYAPHHPKSTVQKALAILRRFGTDAHCYIPGIGSVSGLTAGNYLDSNGSTGFAAVDSLDGLVLDAAGSVGPLLKGAVAPLSSTTGFAGGQATLSLVSNEIVFTQTAGIYAQVVVSSALVAEIGKTYRVEATFRRGTHTSIQMQVQRGAAGSYAVIVATSVLTNTTNVTKELYFTATATDTIVSVTSAGVPGDTSYVASFTVQEVTGIHATASGAARPSLQRGAYNLHPSGNLVGTVATSIPISMSPTGAGNPGTILAAEVVGEVTVQPYRLLAATGGIHGLQGSPAIQVTLGQTYTVSGYVRVPTGAVVDGSGFFCYLGGGTPGNVTLASAAQLNAQAKDVWVRYSVPWTPTVANPGAGFSIGQSSATASSTFDMAAIQIETGSIASAYSPTTTAAASNPNAGLYSSRYSGAQSLALGSVPFQMADDHCVIVAAKCDSVAAASKWIVNPASGAASQCVGSLLFSAGNTVGAAWIDDAVAVTSIYTASPATSTVVATAVSRTNAKQLRVNGAQVGATDSTVKGATTVTGGAIGMLKTSGSSPLTGTIGPIILIKGAVTDADLLTLERFVASLTPNGPVF
jgi:hypothetical protein